MKADDVEVYLGQCNELQNAKSRLRGAMCAPDDERDRPRIKAVRKALTVEIEGLTVRIADTPDDVVARACEATKSYPCAGSRDGCTTRVSRPGAYCRQCAFDEE